MVIVLRCSHEIACVDHVHVGLYARLAQSIPVVVGKPYGHHVGKELYLIAYL